MNARGHFSAPNAILAWRVRTTRRARDVIDQLRVLHDQALLDTRIRENVRVAEAYAWAELVTTYAPRSHGSTDHRATAAELSQRIAV